jgi:ribosomal protein S18 acetylase RimI-like enzyme
MSKPAPDFVIFPAGPSDDEDLARVHVTSWRETYRGLLPEGYLAAMNEATHTRRFHRALIRRETDEVILAAADRRGIFGYAQAMPSRRRREGEAEIATLYVLRASHGIGAGQALVADCARAMAAQGATSLMISVLRDNIRARGFYEHLGGQAEAPRPEMGPGGVLYEVSYLWPDIRTLI